MTDHANGKRKHDATHVCRLICRLQESVGDGCQCDGDQIRCKAVVMYARHAAAIITFLEKTGHLTYEPAP